MTKKKKKNPNDYITHKRGALSTEEMRFIEQNCGDMTFKEIAKKLNRNVGPIERYVRKKNLKAKDLSQEIHLKHVLRNRYYYKELKKQMNKRELEFFENHWTDFFIQFNEDVTHTEEMQIVEVVRTEILINRSMEDRQQVIQNIARIEKLIREEMNRPVEDRDKAMLANLQAQLGGLIGSKSSHITEHEKLLTKKEKYLKDLKGTREQRKKIADDAKTNFLLWLRQLDALEVREAEGIDMEIHRVAAEKERARLSEFHEFADGEVDQPLLNHETVMLEDESAG